jgi:glycosyltransferase involved in cell wall biosynthesis
MRVAVFAESYLPHLSGVTISTETLVRGLASAGHDVMLVAPRARGIPPEVAAGVAWLPSYQLPRPVPAGYRMPWPMPSAATQAAVAFAPDVVHAQSPFVSGLMARAVARRAGAPLVFTHHTRFADYAHYLGLFARPGSAAVDAYLRRYWAACAAVIAPSQHLAAEIEARLAGSRRRPLVRVVPTGIDLAAVRGLPRADPRTLAGWPAGSVVAASLGRLALEKNVGRLVDAFAMAAGADPRLRLLLIGGGPLEEELRDRATALGTVHLAGRLPHRDALMLLKGADLFAFASQTETQGLVLAEALACGLPVVARAGPAVDESVRDGIDGLIVRGMDELSAALVALAASPERRAELARDALSGSDRFGVERRIEQVVSVYREV